MAAFSAVASALHQKMKFPVGDEVGEVLGDWKMARKCYVEEVRIEQKALKASFYAHPEAREDGIMLENVVGSGPESILHSAQEYVIPTNVENYKPNSALATPRVALLPRPARHSKSSSALATPRVPFYRERISRPAQHSKSSSALATPRVALLRERISPTSSAPKLSSTLAPPRVASLSKHKTSDQLGQKTCNNEVKHGQMAHLPEHSPLQA
ncbi:hypothetical protein F511_28605 [Dorcoceras hygrometricum]|uniref:Uncharacterized protein n=1 Tax=Dorcoceras hygrometricum TaxID=472368 RepID=A0A2Z7DDH8_9LAMI|nr:hypothetical protein F511_28605 [Dorcoceras hygrometricum]